MKMYGFPTSVFKEAIVTSKNRVGEIEIEIIDFAALRGYLTDQNLRDIRDFCKAELKRRGAPSTKKDPK